MCVVVSQKPSRLCFYRISVLCHAINHVVLSISFILEPVPRCLCVFVFVVVVVVVVVFSNVSRTTSKCKIIFIHLLVQFPSSVRFQTLQQVFPQFIVCRTRINLFISYLFSLVHLICSLSNHPDTSPLMTLHLSKLKIVPIQ